MVYYLQSRFGGIYCHDGKYRHERYATKDGSRIKEWKTRSGAERARDKLKGAKHLEVKETLKTG